MYLWKLMRIQEQTGMRQNKDKSMNVIGITGGIGSGKSRVLQFMEQNCGAFVCQADFVASQLQKPGKVCYDEIVRCFGEDVLCPDLQLDRKKLAQIVFADKDKLVRLNQIVHPQVKQEIRALIEQEKSGGRKLFVIEAALLLEDHYDEICDELWYIYTEEAIRIQRLKKQRGYSDEQIRAVFQNQSKEEVFRKYCSQVIDNSGAFENTSRQVLAALEKISNSYGEVR